MKTLFLVVPSSPEKTSVCRINNNQTNSLDRYDDVLQNFLQTANEIATTTATCCHGNIQNSSNNSGGGRCSFKIRVMHQEEYPTNTKLHSTIVRNNQRQCHAPLNFQATDTLLSWFDGFQQPPVQRHKSDCNNNRKFLMLELEEPRVQRTFKTNLNIKDERELKNNTEQHPMNLLQRIFKKILQCGILHTLSLSTTASSHPVAGEANTNGRQDESSINALFLDACHQSLQDVDTVTETKALYKKCQHRLECLKVEIKRPRRRQEEEQNNDSENNTTNAMTWFQSILQCFHPTEMELYLYQPYDDSTVNQNDTKDANVIHRRRRHNGGPLSILLERNYLRRLHIHTGQQTESSFQRLLQDVTPLLRSSSSSNTSTDHYDNGTIKDAAHSGPSLVDLHISSSTPLFDSSPEAVVSMMKQMIVLPSNKNGCKTQTHNTTATTAETNDHLKRLTLSGLQLQTCHVDEILYTIAKYYKTLEMIDLSANTIESYRFVKFANCSSIPPTALEEINLYLNPCCFWKRSQKRDQVNNTTTTNNATKEQRWQKAKPHEALDDDPRMSDTSSCSTLSSSSSSSLSSLMSTMLQHHPRLHHFGTAPWMIQSGNFTDSDLALIQFRKDWKYFHLSAILCHQMETNFSSWRDEYWPFVLSRIGQSGHKQKKNIMESILERKSTSTTPETCRHHCHSTTAADPQSTERHASLVYDFLRQASPQLALLSQQ